MKKWLFILLFFSSLIVTVLPLQAEEISDYEIIVEVKQSGELHIVETIDYDFGSLDRHGIFRDIPFTIKHKSTVKNIGLSGFTVEMDGETVKWKKLKKKSKNAGEIIRLKIGSPSSTITGKHRYRIAYKVEKGVLPAAKNKKDDAIRWNVIGTGWNVPLHNIRAKIFLPDAVSRSNSSVSTFTGLYGSTISMATSRWINEHQLEATVGSLQPFEGLTVEIAYPANLLDQNGLDNVKLSFLEQLFGYWHWAALLGLLGYFRNEFKRHAGFSDERSIAVQYTPPKGLSLLRSGLILDKSADEEDFAAAIMELGYLGYLEIEQEDSILGDKLEDVPILGSLYQKTLMPTLIRTKKQDDDLTDDQRYLLNEILFRHGDKFELKPHSEDTASTLKDGFETINKRLYAWSVNTGYFSEDPKKVRTRFLGTSIFLILIVLALAIFTLAKTYGAENIFILIFPVVFGGVGLSMFFGSGIFNKIFGLVFAFAGLLPMIGLYDAGLTISKLLFGPIGVVILLIAVMVFVYRKLGKFTQKGALAQKHLLGLQAFIKRVKKDELQRRLATDPLYLEKLLPYAVLFGETKHWLSFFDDLNVTHPTWYHGDPSNMRHFSSSMQSAATAPSQSSGGGGFSGGGGSSGGGGGGGGGGSW